MKSVVMTDTKRAVMIDKDGQETGYYVEFTVTNATSQDGGFNAQLEYHLPNETGGINDKVNPITTYRLFDELYDRYVNKLIEECEDD